VKPDKTKAKIAFIKLNFPQRVFLKMLTVAIIDALADSRVRLASTINASLSEPGLDFHLLPRISIIPLALQELKFHTAPQVIIVGPGLIEQEITTVAAIRAQLPDVRILALVPSDRNRIGSVEHLIRLGADDVIDAQAPGRELITRLVLLARKIERKKGGKLILVEGVKGGVGATSITAALAEVLAKLGKKIVVVDGDSANRGLSRFLRCRPLINENLQLILDGLRSSTSEFVAQTKAAVSVGAFEIDCVSPPASEQKWSDADGLWIRNFMSTIEVLDEAADFVLIDIARFTGVARETLYRSADSVVLVGSQDPACLPAVVERVKLSKGILAPDVPVVILRNERDKDGISLNVWCRELHRISDISQVKVLELAVPYIAAASRWPVSGFSLLSLGNVKMQKAFELTVAAMGASTAVSASHTLINAQAIGEIANNAWGAVASVAKKLKLSSRANKNGVNSLPAIGLQSADSHNQIAALNPDVGLKNMLELPQEFTPAKSYNQTPQLEFFVSEPVFTGASHIQNGQQQLVDGNPELEDEMLVSPARMSAA